MIRPRGYVPILIFTLLPFALDISPGLMLASFAIVSWALIADLKPRLAPKKWLLAVLTLASPFAIFFQFGTLLGPDAATPLLMLLVALKLFEVYTYRDSIVILALILLIGMYHLVFRQDLIATVYILALLLWVFILLFKRHQPEGTPGQSGLQFRSLLGPETLVSLPVALLMFFFFPRITSPFGRFIETQESTTGFSDELRPGDMAKLANSDEIAFRVEFKSGEQPLVSDLYFFGQSLSETDGINWSKPKRLGQNYLGRKLEGPAVYDYRLTIEPRYGRQVFYLTNSGDLEIKGTNSPFAYMTNDSILLRDSATKTFQVVGKATKSPIKTFVQPDDYLDLPETFLKMNPRTAAVIEKLKSRKSTRHQLVRDLLTFFGQQKMTYSLETPQYRNVDELLFDKKIGFCEHFASAFALMVRAAGVPARVVAGFQGGEFNEYGNYMIVRDRQAHAWVEVLQEDNTWILADPTAAVNLRRISLGDNPDRADALKTSGSWMGAALASSLLYLDSVNSRLTLFYLNFDGASQIQFLENLGFTGVSKKTLWIVLGSVILGVSLLIYLLLRWNRVEISLQARVRGQLNQKLQSLPIEFLEIHGPLEILTKLSKSEDPKARKLLPLVEEYTRLYYMDVQHTPDEARQLLTKIDQI